MLKLPMLAHLNSLLCFTLNPLMLGFVVNTVCIDHVAYQRALPLAAVAVDHNDGRCPGHGE